MTNREMLNNIYGFWVIYPMTDGTYSVVYSDSHDSAISDYKAYIRLDNLQEVSLWLNREAVTPVEENSNSKEQGEL